MNRHDRYPSSEFKTLPLESPSECSACNKPATAQVVVRWGPMRGSDIDAHPVCNRHAKMYDKSFRQCIAHMFTKEKFFAKKDEAGAS